MMRQNKQVEILSPAGNVESVTAAVLNGADAVYLGQKALNARQNAENFTTESFFDIVRYCHLHHVKVYQTLNTVVFDEELSLLRDTVKIACEAGVDAFIVQDFGVLRLVKTWCSDMRIHASTQMTVHTVQGALLLKDLGVARVVLARELSQEQIREIAEQTGIEIEVFVHGALCMSVSGQCYLSAMIGGRSGNKGSCAGTCRLPFSCVNDKQGYDLSLKDNCLANQFDALTQLGITSLKIEGRMKRPEYVAAATNAYASLKHGEQPNMDMLQAVFSRSGFTDGYFTGKIGSSMFGIRQKEDVMSATNDVFRTLRETYRKEKAFRPVTMKITINRNQPARLFVSCGETQIEVMGQEPQEALHKPITKETVQEALQKLGGTVFFLDKLDCNLEEGLAFPKSALNELRRKAIEGLEEKLTSGYEVAFQDKPISFPNRIDPPIQTLRARFERVAQIPPSIWDQAEFVILTIQEVLQNTEVLLPYSSKIILEPERFMAGTEKRVIMQCQELFEKGFIHLAISNPAHIRIGQNIGMQMHGTNFLNCTNSISAMQYKELGLLDMTLSFENTVQRLNNMRGDLAFGYVAYGLMPLMLLKNCPIKRHKSCKDCKGNSSLTDRIGAEFPILCHHKEYQELLNSRTLWVLDKKKDFYNMSFAVLYFTVEKKEECETVIKAFENGQPPSGEFTRGLYYRTIQ